MLKERACKEIVTLCFFCQFCFPDLSGSPKYILLTVSSTDEWREAQADVGRGPRRTQAKVSGKEQGSSVSLQTEEESMGDVAGEEGRGAHTHKPAATGIEAFHYVPSSIACTLTGQVFRLKLVALISYGFSSCSRTK